jgi:hypothetical protein
MPSTRYLSINPLAFTTESVAPRALARNRRGANYGASAICGGVRRTQARLSVLIPVTPTSRDNELAQRLAFPETSSLSPQILESKKVLAEFSAALRDLKAPIRASRWKWRLTWSPPSGTTNKGNIPRLNRRSAAASTAGRSLSMAG